MSAPSSRPSALALVLHNRPAAAGLGIAAALALIALAAPLLPLTSPDATAPAERLLRPLAEGHLLGTDHLCRDLLSRLVWGTRTSIGVGLSASLIAALVGALIGLVAGYAGGRTDGVLMRGIDMLMAFPYVLLALAIVAVLGPGLQNALYAIAVVNIPFFARTIRGVTLGLARRELVDAARLSGKGPAAILFTEILPNVLSVIVITLSTTLGWMILETAGLSFLGLGAQPPLADLGSMLGEGRKLLFTAPHVSVIPGLLIFLLVIGVNLLCDGMRDALDPGLRSGVLRRPAVRTLVDRPATGEAPAEESGACLDVRGLNTVFRLGGADRPVVSALDLAIAPGECLGLVGESGCGKSMTALSLTGLAPSPPAVITSGEVRLDGVDLLGIPDTQLRALRGGAVAHVFQDPLSTLHPSFRVGDQIAESARAHPPVGWREARRQALGLLDLVRIPSPERRLDAYPHELSGGMRQRVGIAMALANDARLLIADEPTTALDVTVQARVLALLNRLRRERATSLLFITHDLGVVSELCDRVAVMYAGRIVETGPTGRILAAPAHPYTRMLIDCVPSPEGYGEPLAVIPGAPPAPDAMPPGCAFAPRCPRSRPACSDAVADWRDLGGGHGVACLAPEIPSGPPEPAE